MKKSRMEGFGVFRQKEVAALFAALGDICETKTPVWSGMSDVEKAGLSEN